MIVAYLVRSFPRLSQTFVLDELLNLEALGVDVRLFTLADGDDGPAHEHLDRLRAPVQRLDPAPVPDIDLLTRNERDHEDGYHAGSLVRCAGQAVALARALEADPVDHLHAHFAHDPALVANLANRLTGVPFSFTGHARDVHQVARGALARRAAAASFVVACCQATAAAMPAGTIVIPHGVDLGTFRHPDGPKDDPPVVLCVARVVEKKGVGDLLEALAVSQAHTRVHLRIVGDGPLRDQLERRAGPRVTFVGPLTRGQLLDEYRRASVFALTPVRTAGGDVDGIPNVILEAMACGLPVVSTTAGGVPEAVTSGVNGLLARPGDVPAIAAHLDAVLADAHLGRRLGHEARDTVEERFDNRVAAQALYDRFATTTAMWPSTPSSSRSASRSGQPPGRPATTRW